MIDKQWLEPSVILIFHIQNKPSAFNPPSIHVLYEYCADARVGSLSRRLQILPHRRETVGDMTVRSVGKELFTLEKG